MLGSPQWPPPLELQSHSPLWEENWSQNLTMTPRENTGNASKDKLEKHSKDLSPCHQTRRRLWCVRTKACILTENWQHVLTTVHSHTSGMQCYSFPFGSGAIKVILFPFPPWSRAVIPFPIGLSCHNTDQTPHNWRDGRKFWNCRKAVTQSAWHTTVPYSSLCADFTWHVLQKFNISHFTCQLNTVVLREKSGVWKSALCQKSAYIWVHQSYTGASCGTN